MMDSSPGINGHKASASGLEPSQWETAGVKRPAPSSTPSHKQHQQQLLPAFEPLSSSPRLPPVSAKRQHARPGSTGANGSHNAHLKYPTPVPTSSTGILSSSPVQRAQQHHIHGTARSGLQRTQSTVSERAPLSAVPELELSENGETLLMGRSSNSSHYQLSANRLISRVHVMARYVPATAPLESNKVEIKCNGWNGLKVHCQGRTWDLSKGDTFSSESEGAEIMIDVQDARVLVHWPRRLGRDALGNLSDSSWEDSPRPSRKSAVELQSSPLRRQTRIASPESPTPAHRSLPGRHSPDLDEGEEDRRDREPSVQIYEDASADEQELPKRNPGDNVEQSFATEVNNSFSSDLSDPLSDDDDENYPNEENDPIIHSFGPFGANLNSRMASFSASSPKRRRLNSHGLASRSPAVTSASRALSTAANSSSRSSKSATPHRGRSRKGTPTPTTARASDEEEAQEDEEAPEEAEAADAPEEHNEEPAGTTPGPDLSKVDVPIISNHVVNQLAFSRLSSNPLSVIMSNLPHEEKEHLTLPALQHVVESTACIGIIPRQGKDAAGKPLESEYYYIPERDTDEHRRAAVVDDLRKPSLRNCRKHHVQYYWKRPRTP